MCFIPQSVFPLANVAVLLKSSRFLQRGQYFVQWPIGVNRASKEKSPHNNPKHINKCEIHATMSRFTPQNSRFAHHIQTADHHGLPALNSLFPSFFASASRKVWLPVRHVFFELPSPYNFCPRCGRKQAYQFNSERKKI